MFRRMLYRCMIVIVTGVLVGGAALPRAVHAAPPQLAANPAPALQEETEWLVMLYQNADDEVLEGDIYTDLNEAELIGSTDDVTIVSQFDRYDGAFDGDGDWTTAKRYFVTQDDDLETVNSEELEDSGRDRQRRPADAGRLPDLGDHQLPGQEVRADPFRPWRRLDGRLE